MLYIFKKVIRAEESPGGLAAFRPTTSIDLFPLGLILVEILHPDFRSVYFDDEDARARLSGHEKPLIPESALTELRESFRDLVCALLEESPGKRWSASKVIKASMFAVGMNTQLRDIKAGQDKIREDIAEVYPCCCASLFFFKLTNQLLLGSKADLGDPTHRGRVRCDAGASSGNPRAH